MISIPPGQIRALRDEVQITIACNGAGLASFHKWNIKRPGPLMRNVMQLGQLNG